MGLMHSTMVPLGTPAVSFELSGSDSKVYSLESFADKTLLVIIFMCKTFQGVNL